MARSWPETRTYQEMKNVGNLYEKQIRRIPLTTLVRPHSSSRIQWLQTDFFFAEIFLRFYLLLSLSYVSSWRQFTLSWNLTVGGRSDSGTAQQCRGHCAFYLCVEWKVYGVSVHIFLLFIYLICYCYVLWYMFLILYIFLYIYMEGDVCKYVSVVAVDVKAVLLRIGTKFHTRKDYQILFVC